MASSASVTLTRTADTNAYLANDVIGAATGATAALSFPKLGVGQSELQIVSTTLEIDDTGIISGETSYTLHLYSATPPSALGDNAPWDLPSGDRASYLGSLALGTPADVGSSLFIAVDGITKEISLQGEGLFAYLVTVGPYTPSSARVYRITIHAKPVV